MNNIEQKVISDLKAYAAYNIHILSEQDKLLNPIDNISKTFVDNIDKIDIISDEKAKSLVQYSHWDPEKDGIEDTIGEPLDQETFLKLRKLAKIVIELAIQTNNTDKQVYHHLVEVADYLHPLYSRDQRTVELGFELQEYTDFFVDYNQEEREKFGEKLLDEWQKSKYID